MGEPTLPCVIVTRRVVEYGMRTNVRQETRDAPHRVFPTTPAAPPGRHGRQPTDRLYTM
jgi:hypothetical protein